MNLTDDEIRVKVARALDLCEHPIDQWVREGTEGDMELVCKKCGKALWEARHPHWLTSVDAALTLCDRLRGEGWELTLERPGLRDWIVTFEVPRGRSVEARDSSLARAICLAFLKVQDSVAHSL